MPFGSALRWFAAAAALVAAGCASAPPAKPPGASLEQKMSWILELEDRRILQLPPPPPPVVSPKDRRKRVPPPPPRPPGLTALVADTDARVRRRAALAIGRSGVPEGTTALITALADVDPDVRQMAAFALGLLGAPAAQAAVQPLTAALADASPLVRGRAAEALGSIGARGAAPAIGRLAAEYAAHPAVAAMQPDDEAWPAAPEADAFKLAIFALVRLNAYDPLASAVLGQGSRPVSTWWPVAYALQRISDPRNAPDAAAVRSVQARFVSALRELTRVQGRYTPAFAARALGQTKDPAVAPALLPLLENTHPPEVVVSAIRALAQVGAAAAGPPLVKLAGSASVDANVRLEAIKALGDLKTAEALPIVQDLLTDEWPTMRAAALGAAAAIDQETFILVLAGLEPDRHWTVRAALADLLATLPPDIALERLRAMLRDEDKRVVPHVLSALVRVKAEDAAAAVVERLKDPDFALRAAAARLVGELKPAGGVEALREAYQTGLADPAYSARAAALEGLAEYGGAAASDAIKAALTDKDWAVRLKAVDLLAKLDPAAQYGAAIRPAPVIPVGGYDAPLIQSPPFSPHVFIETARGTIEIELAVLDAPQTSMNFMALARKGFFNGLQVHRVVPNFVVQDGDPRGDGEGGPGYTIRDELNDRPYLRGTVGMALDWRDTGGSQFFITHSPQPHLDARYTVFGHVVNGMDVVDRIRQGDVVQRVRVWDGTTIQ
jgi:cyclophilin family peptidyl-prolyl cis-trans isomerase/HEAT repeat protein